MHSIWQALSYFGQSSGNKEVSRMYTEVLRRTAEGKRYLTSPSWPRIQRLIFALIDGRRTKIDIARLLSSGSVSEVEQILDTLRRAGLVE